MKQPNDPQATPDWLPEGAHCSECGRHWHADPECFPIPECIVLGAE
ncbi:MAG: hypothetical protein ACRDYZ_12070 [Acidimicrobiales bacterium]